MPMSRIFLSHSSANNAEAVALNDWLISHGWDDVFLDLDPERGLKAGERWQAALKHAAERCELVIFLVSPAWAQSKWCLAEFLLAKNLNKRIFGVIVEPTPFSELPVEMTAEWQLVDLTRGARDYVKTVVAPGAAPRDIAFASDELNRLRIGLMQAGLDARYFAWPPQHDADRAPYRGLRPLEAEDAGIFFGRDGPVVLGLDMLRGLREAAAPRLLVILGASGAGKSSFMRAGLMPRLAREDQHFLTLPIIRPERAVITGETGLIASLEQALRAAGLARTRADIRAAVSGGFNAVIPMLMALQKSRTSQDLASGVSRKPPTLILPVDQAEELFLAEGAEEAEAFLKLLAGLANEENPALIALFTIRSDNYERLQSAKELEGLRQHTLSLPPMPQGSYADVIKGPARRLEGSKRALKIEEPLVDALLSDIEAGGAKDALPLLAFTMERLYCEHGSDGDLKLSEYEQLGRVKGSIEAAVEQAFKSADSDARIPRDRTARLLLLRRGLIPWLAGIDPDTGAPRRRVARLSEIPAEARPLIDHLVEQRLLATDIAKDTGEKTIEPAHEALLRQWGLLQGWLAEDAALLSVLDGVKRAARDWAANGKGAAWITHSGDRLKAAEGLSGRTDLAANLDPMDVAYLAGCRVAEQAATEKERSTLRSRTRMQRAIGLLLLGIIGGLVGFIKQDFLKERYNYYTVMLKYSRKNIEPYVLSSRDEKRLKPGRSFRECKVDVACPEMVVVPAGSFEMGSGDGDEHPMHRVRIAAAFAISKYELTFDDWDVCVSVGACPERTDSDFRGKGQPVVSVSWDDAKRYADWLALVTRKPYRLLSEAEWEYAAKSNKETKYSWGDDIGSNNANCDGCGSKWDKKQPAPVGTFQPNPFGIFDMHGNVSEWVDDLWHDNYKGAPSDGTVWHNVDKTRKVVRGGCWDCTFTDIRSVFRDREPHDYRDAYVGFRVARTLLPPNP